MNLKDGMSGMTPPEIVHELDKYIVGQGRAKRAVAIALRNRWRRLQVAEPLRQEITPKNILLIGPTGVGKTEIARRLARLADAPFIKVERPSSRKWATSAATLTASCATWSRSASSRPASRRRAACARGPRRRPRRGFSTRCCRPPARLKSRKTHPAEIQEEAARGRARRQGDRHRGGGGQPQMEILPRRHEELTRNPGHAVQPRRRAAAAGGA